MTISTRNISTGTLLVNGSFDEWTGAPVINGNVVLWLDAGQTASYSGTGTTWTDLSTNALNGTLVNTPTFDTSGYIKFNGSNQYVSFASNTAVNFTGTSSYSLEAWINPTAIPSSLNYQGIINHESDPGTGRDGWNLWLYGNSQISNTTMAYGTERFGLGNNGGISVNVTVASTIGIWQHLVTTYDGTTLRLYRNGVQIVSGLSPQSITNTTVTTTVASRGVGSYFNGNIAVTKIYNYALTAGAVLQNYNALVGRYGIAANTSGTALQRTTANTVLAEQFDEVTYNTVAPVIKNNFIYSQDQSNVNWIKQNSTVIANAAIAPDGTLTASKLIGNAGITTRKSAYQSRTITANVYYTYSIYLKKAEFDSATIWFDTVGTVPASYNGSTSLANLTTGTITNAQSTLTSVGNGWYKCITTAAANISSFNFQVSQGDPNGVGTPTGDGTSGIYIWGAQLELGNVATIYQGTAAANTLVSSSMTQRVDSGGNMYVSNIFDEFTGAPVVNSSLILWLDAGQTASYPGTGTTWTDLSSNSNSPTLTNSPTFNTILGGGALTFNGTTNYAVKTTTNGFPSGASPFTLSAWFYPTNSSSNQRVVAYGTENTGQLVSIRINSGGAYIVSFAHWGGVGYDVSNGSTVNGNAWNNVVEVFDGTNDYMYINGTLVGTFTPSTLNISANSDFYIGKRATGENFIGSVGQVMLYNRVLTADEISTNFNALRNRYGI